MGRWLKLLTVGLIVVGEILGILVISGTALAAVPVVSSCTPSTGNRGESSKSVVIAGSNFTGSTRVNFGSRDWDFETAGEYTYDTGKVVVSGGSAALVAPCYSHWMLNESSGTNVADSSGNGRNGTIVGSPQYWVAGKLNNCIRLAGQYVDFGAIADWERTNSFSAECWFKVGTITGNAIIFGKELWSGTYQGWSTYLDASGLVYFLACNWWGGNNYLQVSTVTGGYNDNAWHHAVWTYNGTSSSSGVVIYLDGVAQSVNVLQDTLSASIKTSATMQMGAASAAAMWPGDIDESVLYTSVMSPADVTARYNGGAGTQTIVGSYDTSDPPIVGNNTLSFAEALTSFTTTETTPSGTAIQYQVSHDNGANYKYWTGAAWSISDLSYSQSSPAADINSHISTLISSGTFKVRAMLHSTGASTPVLSNIQVGSGITVNSFVVDNSAQITANVTISWSAPLGARDVIIKNADGEGVGSAKFTINAPTPTVTNTNPTYRNQGETSVPEVITGTGFIDASVVAFSGTGVSVDSFVVDTSTQITATITVGGAAPLGFRDVSVTTPGGTGTGIAIFEVRTTTPIISTVTPSTGNRGESLKAETIAGSYFTGATSVSWSGTGVTVDDFFVDSDIQITCHITIAWDATLGLRDVSVTTPVGSGTGTNKFTVNAPTPTVTTCTPSQKEQNETLDVTIAGTGFIGATVVAFSGTGVTVNSFLVDNSAQITASITIATGATVGWRNVSVTTPGGTGTGTSKFEILWKYEVTGVSPNTGYRNEHLTPIVSGHRFTGATSVSFGAGIAVNSFSVISDAEIDCDITIAAGATYGARDVVVVVGSHTLTSTGGFAVLAVFEITSVDPNTGRRADTELVIIMGGQFTGTTGVSFGTGVTVGSFSVISDSEVHANISVSGTATLGYRDVSVTTGSGTVTLTNGFQVEEEFSIASVLRSFGLLFFCLCLGGGLTAFGWKSRFMPVAVSASVVWFVLMIIIAVSPDSLGVGASITTGWVILLVLACIAMAFVPLLLQMRADIKHEVDVRGGKVSWTSRESPPNMNMTKNEQRIQRQKEYKQSFRKRLRGG